MNYLAQHGSTKATPQTEAMHPGQVENSAGGFVFALDSEARLRRFLILGAEGGTYYVGERDFVRDNLAGLTAALGELGPRFVDVLIEISVEGRAKSNDPALFALAFASVKGDEQTRQVAYKALPLVARIGTHLFHFLTYREGFGGWSRGLRRAVASWYLDRPLASLALQLVKYRQRDGWSHRDVLRLAHVKPDSIGRDVLFKFAVTGEFNPDAKAMLAAEADEMEKVRGFILAQEAASPAFTVDAIQRFNLPREALKPEHLDSPEVWTAMLNAGMPVEAMVRNLATMTRNGTIKPLGMNERVVASTLTDPAAVGNSKLHPLSVLNARAIYGTGGGNPYGLSRGVGFTPSNTILAALDDAFHLSFGNVEPAGKRFLLGLDVSGSMGSVIGGGQNAGLSCRDAAAAMALVTAKTEPAFHTIAFTSGPGTVLQSKSRYINMPAGVSPFPMSGEDTLDGIVGAMGRLDFGATDCALPMLYAIDQDLEVDCFVVYTDNETWAGDIHPAQALAEYRRKSGIDAKLVVCGMTSTGFTIADPKDPGMLDVVGFDTATPSLISAFARGDL